jgi:hypothetical protein
VVGKPCIHGLLFGEIMRDQSYRIPPERQDNMDGTADAHQGVQGFRFLERSSNADTAITVSPDLIQAMAAIRQAHPQPHRVAPGKLH